MKKGKNIAIIRADLDDQGEDKLMCNLIEAFVDKDYNIKVYRPNVDSNNVKEKLSNFSSSKSSYQEVNGSIIPKCICSKLEQLLAYVRLLLCALGMVLFNQDQYDYIVVDCIPFTIPILRLKCSKILYYCHDSVIEKYDYSQKHHLIKICLFFKNLLIQLVMGMSHTILVNSAYMQLQFQDKFSYISVKYKNKEKSLIKYGTLSIVKKHYPRVLHPAIDELNILSVIKQNSTTFGELVRIKYRQSRISKDTTIISAINSFDRKSNFILAIKSFASFLHGKGSNMKDCSLLIGGLYDSQNSDHVKYLSEL